MKETLTATLESEYNTTKFEFYLMFENLDSPTKVFGLSCYVTKSTSCFSGVKRRIRTRRLYDSKKGKYFIYQRQRVYVK